MTDSFDSLEGLSSEEKLSFFMQNESVMFAKFMLTDDAIPKEVKGLFWAFMDKEAALTQLNSSDIRRLMRSLDDTIVAYLMAKPSYRHEWYDEFIQTQLRGKLFMKLKRSENGFERKLNATQIKEIRRSGNTEFPQQEKRGGLMGKVGRFFGR